SAAVTGAAVATSVVIATSGPSRIKSLMSSSLLMHPGCFLLGMGSISATHRPENFTALRLPESQGDKQSGRTVGGQRTEQGCGGHTEPPTSSSPGSSSGPCRPDHPWRNPPGAPNSVPAP